MKKVIKSAKQGVEVIYQILASYDLYATAAELDSHSCS